MDGRRRVEEPENTTGGKGDVRKMRAGVGKSEEVDGRTDAWNRVGFAEGVRARWRGKRFKIAYILCTVTLSSEGT